MGRAILNDEPRARVSSWPHQQAVVATGVPCWSKRRGLPPPRHRAFSFEARPSRPFAPQILVCITALMVHAPPISPPTNRVEDHALAARGGARSREPNWLRYFPAILAAYLIGYFFLGERVHWHGGLGFDGYLYGHLSADFIGMLAQRIPDYYLERFLPSFIVWLSATLLHFQLSTPERIVDAFHIYNSLMLVGSALAWMRIARTLRLSPEVALIGTACLFINWTVLKQYWFFVVQTDVTAFALGTLAALCVIERRLFLLTVVALIASLAWETVMPFTFILILFARPACNFSSLKVPTKAATALSLAATAVAAGYSLYATVLHPFHFGPGGDQVDLRTLPLSIVLMAGYVFYVARAVLLTPGGLSFRMGPLSALAFFIAIWLLRTLALWVMARHFGNGQVVLGFMKFVLGLSAAPVAKPAIFALAMVVSFGPGFLLVLWYLPRILATAAAHSYGALLGIVFTMVLVFDTESRHLVFSYPLLIVFLCVALQEKLGPNRRYAFAFLACSIVLSKFYLPLNDLGMGLIDSGKPVTDWNVLLQFPWQWFLMNLGISMGWIGYAINSVLGVAAGIVLWMVRTRDAPPNAAAWGELNI
jgi:hypothetical protein